MVIGAALTIPQIANPKLAENNIKADNIAPDSKGKQMMLLHWACTSIFHSFRKDFFEFRCNFEFDKNCDVHGENVLFESVFIPKTFLLLSKHEITKNGKYEFSGHKRVNSIQTNKQWNRNETQRIKIDWCYRIWANQKLPFNEYHNGIASWSSSYALYSYDSVYIGQFSSNITQWLTE